MRFPRSILLLALTSILTITSCNETVPSAPAGETTPGTSKTTEIPDEGPLPALRTGVKQPEQLPAATVELLAQVTDAAHYYEFSVPRQDGVELVRVYISGEVHTVATIDRNSEGTVLVRVP